MFLVSNRSLGSPGNDFCELNAPTTAAAAVSFIQLVFRWRLFAGLRPAVRPPEEKRRRGGEEERRRGGEEERRRGGEEERRRGGEEERRRGGELEEERRRGGEEERRRGGEEERREDGFCML